MLLSARVFWLAAAAARVGERAGDRAAAATATAEFAALSRGFAFAGAAPLPPTPAAGVLLRKDSTLRLFALRDAAPQLVQELELPVSNLASVEHMRHPCQRFLVTQPDCAFAVVQRCERSDFAVSLFRSFDCEMRAPVVADVNLDGVDDVLYSHAGKRWGLDGKLIFTERSQQSWHELLALAEPTPRERAAALPAPSRVPTLRERLSQWLDVLRFAREPRREERKSAFERHRAWRATFGAQPSEFREDAPLTGLLATPQCDLDNNGVPDLVFASRTPRSLRLEIFYGRLADGALRYDFDDCANVHLPLDTYAVLVDEFRLRGALDVLALTPALAILNSPARAAGCGAPLEREQIMELPPAAPAFCAAVDATAAGAPDVVCSVQQPEPALLLLQNRVAPKARQRSGAPSAAPPRSLGREGAPEQPFFETARAPLADCEALQFLHASAEGLFAFCARDGAWSAQLVAPAAGRRLALGATLDAEAPGDESSAQFECAKLFAISAAGQPVARNKCQRNSSRLPLVGPLLLGLGEHNSYVNRVSYYYLGSKPRAALPAPRGAARWLSSFSSAAARPVHGAFTSILLQNLTANSAVLVSDARRAAQPRIYVTAGLSLKTLLICMLVFLASSFGWIILLERVHSRKAQPLSI